MAWRGQHSGFIVACNKRRDLRFALGAEHRTGAVHQSTARLHQFRGAIQQARLLVEIVCQREEAIGDHDSFVTYRSVVAVLNVVKCRPPANRTPRPPEVARCSGWLRRQIDPSSPAFVPRGHLPFLHVSHQNPRALQLYERLGYRHRRDIGFWSLQRMR